MAFTLGLISVNSDKNKSKNEEIMTRENETVIEMPGDILGLPCILSCPLVDILFMFCHYLSLKYEKNNDCLFDIIPPFIPSILQGVQI